MILDELSKSLKTGFIDKESISEKLYQPTLLINKKNPRQKVLSTILKELLYCDEFYISVAFVTTSGVATLMNTLKDLEEKGVKGKVVVSQYLNFTQPEALRKLLKFTNIELRIAINQNSHSKGYLFKKSEYHNLIIGSSNLTASALATNKEWNLKVSALHSSSIVEKIIGEFDADFHSGTPVTASFIDTYEDIYNKQKILSIAHEKVFIKPEISPNSMQEEALTNIDILRNSGATKALLISATGTGKTYLSAFDAQVFQPKRLLFVVHRRTIALKSLETFQDVFGTDKTMGIYSGSQQERDKDFLFATVQTISQQKHLDQFDTDHFDYIIIDESHRSGADSYKRLLDYFQPRFLLGMTATPERTDGEDIFSLFDHNIAYEIRLNTAMEEEMLSNFHYYGVTDLKVDDVVQENTRDFALLASDERVENIIKHARFYGSDNGITRGLVFCSRNEESKMLAEMFNQSGFRSLALSGKNSEEERSNAIDLLESDNLANKLDYIFTVDIFNEGIDIPKVNQIIMIRPTDSAIVFVQQLGRGLRKVEGKGYLTVIDFIGNYSNNYLIPIALYGDTSYNKDALRRSISSGSRLIPGSSTINFDAITKKQIFASIDSANMQMIKDLKKDYFLLKYKLGRIPMMMDFIEHGSRDPFLYVGYSKSFLNFVFKVEKDFTHALSDKSIKLLEFFSNELNNAKRVEESIILNELLQGNICTVSHLKTIVSDKYDYEVSDQTVESCLNNLNFKFIREKNSGKLLTLNNIYGLNIMTLDDGVFQLTAEFKVLLKQELFKQFLQDSINYSIHKFNDRYESENWRDGFSLYEKYSRKDVFRILNVEINPVAQNVGGYLVSPNSTHCPIFVNYHKDDDISESTKYEDEFVNNKEFAWMSKSNRKLVSNDVQSILGNRGNIRLPLFIKKSNDEGIEFYYMGDVEPEQDKVEQTSMNSDNGKKVSVVRFVFSLSTPVSDEMYQYLREKEVTAIERTPTLKLVPPTIVEKVTDDKKPNLIPFYDFYAAAGSFSEMQENKDFNMIEVPLRYSTDQKYFSCKVVGESMNRRIANNSICIFKEPLGGSRNGKIVLVENFGKNDEEYNSSFTIKTYASEKRATDDGEWEHSVILLKPNSTESRFEDIVLHEDDCENMRIVGEFVTVLEE
ncbi:MAG: superfamily II DNA or RNA helicase/HKD family nuclease/SOS-response transcriptional repressor LexA [Alteromonadaceae bacterium]|jgi:superfamily II DNA or RNA helicase/HKD family nuclease/SOS-response transcriptional repressor LexA